VRRFASTQEEADMLVRIAVLLLSCAASLAHAQPKPAFIYDQVLSTEFDESSGQITFGNYDLAFAPEGELDASIAVVNSENTIVATFPFFPRYMEQQGVFARANIRGPAELTLTEPGVYNIVFLVNGTPATRLPVVLEQTGDGDDPFNPDKTFQYDGLWRMYANITNATWKDEDWPVLNLWLGQRDMLDQEGRSEEFRVAMTRDGAVVAHTKSADNSIYAKHYQRKSIRLYHPHDEKRPQDARGFTKKGWYEDGSYELIVTRVADGAELRRFVYTAKDGKIAELPQSKLGHEPHMNYIVPRVRNGDTGYQFVEAVWIRQKPKQP
jgi:hypothetical protein